MCRALSVSERLLKCFAGQQHQYFDNLRKQTKEPMNNCKMGIISNYGTCKLQIFYFNVGMKEFWLFRHRQKQAIAWIPDPVQAGITTDFPGLHFKHKGNMIMNGNSTFWPNYPFIGAHFFYYVFSQLSSWDWCLNQPCLRIGSDASIVFGVILLCSISHLYIKAPTLYTRSVNERESVLGSVFKYFRLQISTAAM